VAECADNVEQGFMEQLEAEQAEAEDELKKDLWCPPETQTEHHVFEVSVVQFLFVRWRGAYSKEICLFEGFAGSLW